MSTFLENGKSHFPHDVRNWTVTLFAHWKIKDNLSLTIEHCLHGPVIFQIWKIAFFLLTLNMKNIESTPSVQTHSMFSSRMPLFKHKKLFWKLKFASIKGTRKAKARSMCNLRTMCSPIYNPEFKFKFKSSKVRKEPRNVLCATRGWCAHQERLRLHHETFCPRENCRQAELVRV